MGILKQTLSDFLSPFHDLSSPKYRGQDFPNGMSMIEMDTFGIPTGNSVYLLGNQLPKEVFPFGGKQHLVKEYYPGNSEPTVQIMGAREDDISFKGTFKDRRIQEVVPGQFYGAAYEYAKSLDLMRMRGNIIRLQLGEFIRYGFIESVGFQMKTLGYIDYTINFSVIGLRFPSGCKLLTTPKDIPLQINQQLIAAAAAAASQAALIPDTMPQNIADLLTGYIGTVAGALAAVTTFVDSTIAAAENTERLWERCLGLVRTARTSIAVFKRRVGALDVLVGSSRVSGSQAVSEAKRASNAKYIYNTLHFPAREYKTATVAAAAALEAQVENFAKRVSSITTAKKQKSTGSIESLLLQMERQLKILASTVPLRRVRVRQGDTLQKFALQFYSDATLWDVIFTHNKLLSTELVSGSLLEIPRL